jgi:sodium/proline symporter
MVLVSFGVFLFLFVGIGVLSMRKRQETTDDYLLASQSVKPWLVALSAFATANSGYMFVGLIGFAYMAGLQAIWLMVGLVTGDFLMSTFVHKRLRVQTEKQHALSFAGILSTWHGTDFKKLRVIGGLITLVFVGVYAAAQLNAGSKAMHVVFGWDYSVGAIVGSLMVLLYCFAGGIRASIWTDAAQSFVMIAAMALMLFIAVGEIGGLSVFVNNLHNVSPNYMDWFPANHPLLGSAGPVFFVVGWVFGGIAIIGQPHVMIRFMTLDKPSEMLKARGYYYGWYVTFYSMAIFTALAARLLIPETAGFDTELALPTLAGQLLPEILVGLVLAGLFAATMSTADSQILACTAAITHDLLPRKFSSYKATKLATVFVTAMALTIALSGNKSVFALVLIAWSALGTAFAPLLIVYALKQEVPEKLAIAMMLGGPTVMLLWRYFELKGIIYECAPGVLAGLVIFAAGKIYARLSSASKVEASSAVSD